MEDRRLLSTLQMPFMLPYLILLLIATFQLACGKPDNVEFKNGQLKSTNALGSVKPAVPSDTFDRQLQGNELYQHETIDYGDRRLSDHIRIRFLTEPLESIRDLSPQMDATIDALLQEVLPATSEIWSRRLHVHPAEGNITFSPDHCTAQDLDYNPIMPWAANGGVDNADLLVAVFLNPEANQCFSQALGFSFTCTLDQFDRPIFGAINFCKLLNFPVEANQVRDFTTVATHEVAHLLGHHISLLKYFRNATTGEPLTPRPFVPSNVTCVDGSTRTMVFPSEKTLRLGQASFGLLHYKIVTPRVATVVRNHFDCQTLDGARLENQPFLSSSCTGTHWDERIFFNEIMSAVLGLGGDASSNVLSPVTLALMEDTGWYNVSYAGAPLLSFGHGRGCDFVNQDCIINDEVPEFGKDAFCSDPLIFDGEHSPVALNPVYCNPSHTSLAFCNLFDRSTAPSRFHLGDHLGYFSNPNLVSSLPQADFCPMPIRSLGIDCTANTGGSQIYREETYGSNSKCVNAEVEGRFVLENGTNVTGIFEHAACVSVVCDEEKHRVVVADQVCEYEGQMIEFPSGGRFECPRLTSICPDMFCPGYCSGRGVCNYSADPPGCECFDPNDMSPLCNLGVAEPSDNATRTSSATSESWTFALALTFTVTVTMFV